MMTVTTKNKILTYLQKHYPHAGCELIYQTDYQLLIAVVLSAQTTDQAVNRVTPILFKTFPTLASLAKAKVQQIQRVIQSIGLYKTKAKHIHQLAQQLIVAHDGKVPKEKAALTALPGVGNKTANVMRAEWFKIPEIAVDTHVHRLAWRLGFTDRGDDVTITEEKLRRAIPESRYIRLHHQLIHFGRYACKAKAPMCQQCELQSLCREPKKNLKE
jgi:endonuclease III